jgi:hypothetical protein
MRTSGLTRRILALVLQSLLGLEDKTVYVDASMTRPNESKPVLGNQDFQNI